MSAVQSNSYPNDPYEAIAYQAESTSAIHRADDRMVLNSPATAGSSDPVDTMTSALQPLPSDCAVELGGCGQLLKFVSEAFCTINDAIVLFFIWIASLFGFKREAVQDTPSTLTDAIPLAPIDLPLVQDSPATSVLTGATVSSSPSPSVSISEDHSHAAPLLSPGPQAEDLQALDHFCHSLGNVHPVSLQPTFTILQTPDPAPVIQCEIPPCTNSGTDLELVSTRGLSIDIEAGLLTAVNELQQQLVAAPSRPSHGAVTVLNRTLTDILQTSSVNTTVSQSNGMNGIAFSCPVNCVLSLNNGTQQIPVIGEIALACLQHQDGTQEMVLRARGVARIQGFDVPVNFRRTIDRSSGIVQHLFNQIAGRASLPELCGGETGMEAVSLSDRPVDVQLTEIFAQFIHSENRQYILTPDLFPEEYGNRAMVTYPPISRPSLSVAAELPSGLFSSHSNEMMPLLRGIPIEVMRESAAIVQEACRFEEAVNALPSQQVEEVRLDYEAAPEIDPDVLRQFEAREEAALPVANVNTRRFGFPLNIASSDFMNQTNLNQSIGLLGSAPAEDVSDDPMLRSLVFIDHPGEIESASSVIREVAYEGTPNLLACVWKTMGSETFFDLMDDTPVAFVDGKIVQADASDQNQVDTLLWLASKTYGASLANLVKVRYGLENKQSLTWGDVKSVFVGMGANVKAQHLKELFQQIKNSNNSAEQCMGCQHYLSQAELQQLRDVAAFEQLSPLQMKILVDVFRTVPLAGKRIPTVAALYQGVPPEGSTWFHDPVAHDAALLAGFESINMLNIKDPDLALTEYISKVICYKVLKEGMVVPLLDKEGKLAYFQVGKDLPHRNDAVLPVIMVPLSRGIVDAEHPLEVHFSFRGTQFTPKDVDSLASFNADFDPFGVGNRAFSLRKADLLELICSTLQEDEAQHVKITVHGHSLGGALQMRQVAALAEHLVKQDEQLHIAEHILGDLTSEFAAAERAYYDNVSNIQTGKEFSFQPVLEVFAEGKSFDQLVNLHAQAAAQGSLNQTVLASLQEVINHGLQFKRALHAFTPDLLGNNLNRLLETGLNTRSVFDECKGELQKVQSTARAFQKIVEINAASANAPNVELSLNTAFRENLRRLEAVYPNLKIHLDYVRYEGDIIQDLGGGVLLGFDINSPLLKKRVIWHTPHESLDELSLHGFRGYTVHASRVRYTRKIIDETTPEDALNKILGGSFYWNSATSSTVWWYLTEAGATARLLPHMLLWGTIAGLNTAIYYAGLNRDLNLERERERAAQAAASRKVSTAA